MECGFNGQPRLLVHFGPTIRVSIGFDAAWKPDATTQPPTPGITDVHALIDTGATESCIDNILASDLKLPIVDRKPIAGISGPSTANIYLAQVHVSEINFTIYGGFAGVDLKKGGQVHSALIGRTFLFRFQMSYDGQSGRVTLAQPPAATP